MKLLLVTFFMLFALPSLHAANITAASCSQTDVQNAINSAQAGDRVLVPSGTCTWTTVAAFTPSVTIDKAITVQGQTVCFGRASTLSCSDGTIIVDGTGTGSSEDPILIGDHASGARLTGFTFHDPRTVADSKHEIDISSLALGWRIDHCNFSPGPTNGVTHGIGAAGTGLIDHVYFKDYNTAIDGDGRDTRDPSAWSPTLCTGGCSGDWNWTQTLRAGTVNGIYTEDSEFAYTAGVVLNGATDNYDGARFVFRYNDVQNTNWGNHGLDSTNNGRSALLAEVYNNTFTNSGTHVAQWGSLRGGTYFIFNNTISTSGGSYDTFLDLREYRADPSGFGDGQWGSCNGSNSIDQNTTGQHGWACLDQIGRGPKLSGDTFERSFPGYSWGNSWKGATPVFATSVNICGFQDCTTNVPFQIINNRDFYMEVASFSGAAGTGSGLLAARPGTCTPFVAYWATDTSTLYQCSSTNTWTTYYTPFTYPHPLQSSSTPVAPPTGLTEKTL